MSHIKYLTADVDGVRVFYREAEARDAPALLLLHGFPSAGHMFRDLIPALSDRYCVIAPDLPGFGQSDMPSRTAFAYTFDRIADVIDPFNRNCRPQPVCDLRLRLRRPDWASASPWRIRTASRRSSRKTATRTRRA